MATAIEFPSAFVTGEVSPALFGNTQLTRMHSAAATMRNMWVSYQGGSYSRAGTAFVGFSKQTGRAYPPRIIPFQFSINQGLALEFGNFYMRVMFNGAYVTETSIPIISIVNSDPVQIDLASTPPSHSNGDWLFIAGVPEIPQLNNQTFVVNYVTSGGNTTAFLSDIYGNQINGAGFAAYGGDGNASRIYTLATQFSEQDLAWLKFTQSADVMSICCVNQTTNTEYPPVDLSRISATDWTFTVMTPEATVNPPSASNVTATAVGDVEYQYVATAVSPIDGTESIAGSIGTATDAIDIASTAGSITFTWNPVTSVQQYNVYKATPAVGTGSGNATIPVGAQFGYAGTASGTSFVDTNIIPDFSQVPPLHQNPFARGTILAINVTASGSGYTSITLTINTATGAGEVITPIVISGAVQSFFIADGGFGFLPTDTVTIGGAGTGATATLVVGPQTGTYPGMVAYFQERRAYAYTLNQPDTYFMSQPGSFTNFDFRTPTIDSDAITGTPWSVEVNGIQFMITLGGADMVLTGLDAFLLTGSGGSVFTPVALTPSSQSAQNQGINGCSATVPPIRIYEDVIYVQAKGSSYRDFKFDISNYSYVADDISQNSTHMFYNYNIVQHAWCEEPYHIIWAVRNDGVLLSLTWLKSEKIAGWARHDTAGSFVSVASVTEPPVDALYLAVQRNIGTNTAYTIERMDNRLWNGVETTWCVDCGFTLPQSTPSATLSASSPTGLGGISGVTNLVGGAGYSAGTVISVVDNNGKGPGAGAVLVPTIVNGVITAITETSQGSGYVNPAIVIFDPAGSAGGSGASATAVLNNSATFTASAAIFSGATVGQVIRMGGGKATVTQFLSQTQVVGNITIPITATYPDNTGSAQAIPQSSGNWTLSAPITVVHGLDPLIGATVTGLADGIKIPPQVVSAQGTITLATPASQITVGLAFQAQLQSVYLDTGEPTTQGQRKNIPEATARVYASGPFQMGSNQPDGSTLSPTQIAPQWTGLQPASLPVSAPYNSSTVPLYTGDIRVPINTGDAKPGQVCVQQSDPFPLNVLCFLPQVLLGDTSSQNWPQKQGKNG